MLSKKDLIDEIEKLSQTVMKLQKDIEDLKKTQEEIRKTIEELDNKISFLNVLSAKINTTYYHITYDIDDKLKGFFTELEDALEAMMSDLHSKMVEVRETAPKKKKTQ